MPPAVRVLGNGVNKTKAKPKVGARLPVLGLIRLRRDLRRAGISLRRLAREAGISEPHACNVLAGRHKSRNVVDTARRLLAQGVQTASTPIAQPGGTQGPQTGNQP